MHLLKGQTNASMANRRRWFAYMWWSLLWVTGHMLGGGLLGAGIGWMGSMLVDQASRVGPALFSAVVLAGALHHLRIVRLPLPHLPRQIPRNWMTWLPWDVVALG